MRHCLTCLPWRHVPAVDSSHCIANHGNFTIRTNNWALMSPGISSICLETVRAKRGTWAIFLTAASPKPSRQISIKANRINFSLISYALLTFGMRWVTKYDAFSTFPLLVDVMAISSLFLIRAHVFFFRKTPKVYNFNPRRLVCMCRSNLESFILNSEG